VVITIWTFFLAVLLGLAAQYSLSEIESLSIALLVLLVVVSLGVVFDLIGTAAAAADIAPLNAKAARRVAGAKRGVYLVQNAEKVSNFCNDVAGDISGVISGTLAAIIVIRLVVNLPYPQAELHLSILLTAIVAAITVGGKAVGKAIAIHRSTEVILFVGMIITQFEKPFKLIKKERPRN